MKKHIHRILSCLIVKLVFASLVFSQQTGQVMLSGSFVGMEMISVLRSIESQYPVSFFYREEWFVSDTVNVRLNNTSLESAVEMILSGKPYTYRLVGNDQVIFLPSQDVADIIDQIPGITLSDETEETYIVIGDPSQRGDFQEVDVTGSITDGATGEPIIGAYVQIGDLLQGVITNTEGHFTISLSPGLYSLVFSSLGFETTTRQVRVLGSGELDIELFERSIEIEDIIVYAQRPDRNVTGNQMSLVELDTRLIEQLPMVSGGRDVIKGLTSMPGINSVGEFSSGINVRGGGEDQNQYLINDAPLFNTTHVFGLLSAVNPDIVDNLTLYKGHIPASYGERISSVIDIKTSETAPETTRILGGIGLFDSKLMAELPIFQDKIYLNLGGRSLYSNWLLKRTDESDLRNSSAFFYDLNASLNIDTRKSRIMLSGYSSFDDFTFNDEVRYAYGSNAASATWNYLINSNMASYLSLSYSDYHVEKDDIHDAFAGSRITTGITYKGLRYRFQYSGISNNLVEMGFNAFHYGIRTGKLKPLDERSLIQPDALEPEQGVEGAVFLNDEWTLNRYLTLNGGVRLSGYAYLGPKTLLSYLPGMPVDSSSISGITQYGRNKIIQSYYTIEPRISAKIQLNDKSSVKVSYNRNAQYLALISNSAVSTPADIWKLSDPYIKPMLSHQVAIGYYRNFLSNEIETSVEFYYKAISNVLEYKKGAKLEMERHIERQLINATGRNYGIEFLVKKTSGDLDGWVAYTYSRSVRKTNGEFRGEIFNQGDYFPSTYDKPHNLNILANYNLNKRITFSANFTFASGGPITLPEYKYTQENAILVFFSEKNKYRMPPYHRLDISLRISESLRIKKRWKGSWSFSLLNVYGRKNAYTIFYKKDIPTLENDHNIYSLYKLYLVGRPVLTVTYNFLF